jgi:hypothetical protein
LTWFWSNNCLVLDEVRANRKRGGSERDEPDKTSGNTGGGRRQSLESRMLGNLHVRFGGGGEETQFGCAPYPYLTGTRARGAGKPHPQEAHVTDAATVRLNCRTRDTL